MVQGTMMHEAVHAFDECRAEVDWTNCIHHACSEVILFFSLSSAFIIHSWQTLCFLSSGPNVCWPTGACSKLERRLSLQNGIGPWQWLEYTWPAQGKQNASREKLLSALCSLLSWLSWPTSSLRTEREKPPRAPTVTHANNAYYGSPHTISHTPLSLSHLSLFALCSLILHGSVLKIKTMSRNVCGGEQYCLFPWTPTADNLRLHGLLTKSLSGVSKTQSLLVRFLKTKGK